MSNTYINAATVEEAVEKCNKERLGAKNRFCFLEIEIGVKKFLVKQYDTWIQIFKFGDIRRGGPPDIKVGQYKEELAKMFREFL
jgi:hypothetical protein